MFSFSEWSDIDLVAQAILFLVAGFDTVSTAMSFLLYELAVNPDVQERLVQEIRDNDAKNGGKFDFDSIQKLPYLDMVVSGKTVESKILFHKYLSARLTQMGG